ncbi:amidase family protein [Stappia sp. ES.058]|uniref:amidase family protein n=1 Tax=Stappia sp. ES.058 TaxID=1881061 RepID=UPI00087D0165|nr:amidase family protein [Stappia sp. ES.058]SDU33358.1 aspartyl-tRNA(Asn)/glutamyl-tRNA(Gln) amidotransferase subunit A [Stappia sp. ES.058]
MGETVKKAEAAIARVEAMGEAAGKLFTQFDPERIRKDAEVAEARIAAADRPLPLSGLLVSVKDLYDEAGQRSTAASRLLRERAPATVDCPVIQRIKAAGAVPFGRTTMSELAYSGVGLNPHYGTPANVFDAEGIPGGSTSGGAVTVGLGLADVALGTDTGGSVRIPAAINGLYGHKPSQDAVPLQGVHPLAGSFDSCGPLARDFETMLAAFAVMSDTPAEAVEAPSGALRLAVPKGAFTNDLDAWSSGHFEAAKARLEESGHTLVDLDLTFLHEALGLNRLLVSAEAHEVYQNDLDQLAVIGDPRVLARIKISETATAEEIAEAYAQRRAVISRLAEALSGFEALIAPTLQIQPPSIREAEAEFDRVNAAMLRNTSLLNLADACAMTMPTRTTGTGRPGALMIGGAKGQDTRVLSVGARLDRDLNG